MRWVLMTAASALVGCTTPVAPDTVAGPDSDAAARHVQQLLDKLDDDPDILHFDSTPAVSELIVIGEPAIEPTLPYLLSENEDTRLHAERVIYGAMMRMHGFVLGRGWSQPGLEQEFQRLSETLWDFEAMGGKSVVQSPVQERQAYIERVKRWLASRRA